MTECPSQARPSFLARYRAGEWNDLFGLPAGALEAGLSRPFPGDRAALADALEAQARARGDRPEQLAAIERLRHPAARAVVTGQQAGLLLGPTYTLSKAVTAVRLAARHDRADRPVVPVFWVASQDHDAGEIDHALLLDRAEKLHRPSLPFPADLPSGRAPLRPAWRDDLAAALRRVDAPERHRRAALELVLDAWDGAGTVADLFARILSALLGPWGLVVLDPMHDAAARLFRPVLEAELADPLAGPRAIRAAGETLKARGERPQLGRAADATNLFVQEGGGPRRLLRFANGAFHPDGRPERRLRREDLLRLLDADPAALTPAAGLRPIVQDAVLPTAATVVGPGELRYFAQLAGVYGHHDVAMPLAWPRATVLVAEPPVARILERYGLDARAFAADPDRALRDVLLARHGHAERFAAALARLDAAAAELLEEVEAIDPTLGQPVERGRATLERTVRRLRRKSGDALARRDEETRAQFARLRAHLLPAGGPQERVLSPFSFFLKFGFEAVLDRFATLDPEGDQVLAIDP